MNNQEQNKFLGKLYDMLLRENIITEKEQAKDLKTKVERVQKYFDKVERVQDKASGNDRYLNMIRELYYDRYIIKKEDIPDTYLESLEKQYLDNGHGHVNLVEPKTEEDFQLREEHINNVIRDQKDSLDNWLNYLMSEDSSYLPMWAKVWAFQGMLGIGNLSENKKSYKRRSNVTVNPFVAIDSEILGQCVELLKDVLDKKEITDSELDKIVKSGNFSKIYGMLLANKKEIKTNGTEGIWVKYNSETEEEADRKETEGIEPEYIKLYNSLQGYNTGWCTAGSRETAKGQICGSGNYLGGDFYVYYSKDENDEYKIPRIAIRMDKNEIGEIRGITENQNIEPDMEKVLEEKLKEFPDADKYKKKVSDMKRLTEIYNKNKQSIELTKEELIFLYEINDNISGFGYGKDPRIEEIKYGRNKRKDLAYTLDCSEKEIGFTENDLYRTLVYYEGDITDSDFESISNLILPKIVKGDLDLRNLHLESLISVEGLKLPESINGNLYLGGLTSVEDLKLPKSIGGSLDLGSLTSAEGLELPEEIGGSLDLDGLTSAEGLKLPESINGYLGLGGLTSAKGLELPNSIGGSLYLESLTSAEGLEFPKNIGLSLYLSNLINTEGLVLPKDIGGSLYLESLTSAEGLELPEEIGGSLDLGGLTSAKGLKLPKSINGNLHLESLISVEGLKLPKSINGNLYLENLTIAKDLNFPKNIEGCLDLCHLTSVEGLKFPESIGYDLDLSGLISAKKLILPRNVGVDLDLRSLTSVEEIEFPHIIGRNLNLRSLISAEGLKLPESIGGNLFLNSLTSLKGVILPDYVEAKIYYNGRVCSLEEIKELQKKEENEYSSEKSNEIKSVFLHKLRDTLLGLDKDTNSDKNSRKGV